MVSLVFPNSFVSSLTLSLPSTSPRAYFRLLHVPFYKGLGYRCSPKTRGLTVVSRAGPSTSSYVFAFVLPLSLLAITVFASIRVSDRLDRQFLEELMVNEAMREADEEEEDDDDDEEEEDDDANDNRDDDGKIFVEKVEEPVLQRTRNRPKREV